MKDFQFCRAEIQQRGTQHTGVPSCFGLGYTAKQEIAKERKLYWAAAIQNKTESVRAGLDRLRVGLPRQAAKQFARLEWLAAKKIEIEGSSMAQSERNGRAAVENKLLRNGTAQFIPHEPLRRGQYVELG